MAVIAKIGLLRKGGKVRTKEGVFEVTLNEDGRYVVPGPAGEDSGLVRYDFDRQILHVERPGVTLEIRFRPELEHTTFEYGGHRYEIGTMDFGAIRFTEAGRTAVRGHVTISGVRLLFVASDLEPIERELAFGLALRGSALDDLFWQEDQPFLMGLKEGAQDSLLREEERRHREDR